MLRIILNKLSVKNLQKIYSLLDENKFSLLNNSEKNNPHRLIRKIEIKLFLGKLSTKKNHFDVLHISLTAPNQFLYDRIDNRVQNRLKLGLFNEIKNLLTKYSWSDPGLNSLAYKEFKTGFDQKNTNRWRFHEHAYARRQKTWFKKIIPIAFIDITNPQFSPKAINLIRKWYNLP